MATLPGFMAGVVTNQQANTAGGSRQDNGSAHYFSPKPSKTPTGATKGIVGANARAAKRKVPRARMNSKGGKVKDC